MTVKSDIQTAIASAESAKGSYATMSNATDDPEVKNTFEQMSFDVDRHLLFLNDRLNFITQNNSLNQ